MGWESRGRRVDGSMGVRCGGWLLGNDDGGSSYTCNSSCLWMVDVAVWSDGAFILMIL